MARNEYISKLIGGSCGRVKEVDLVEKEMASLGGIHVGLCEYRHYKIAPAWEETEH